jgi:hypothetical protein
MKNNMKGQWFRCFIGLHQKKNQWIEIVTNIRGEEVGKNYISICDNCGHISSKFIPSKLENLTRY